MGALKLFLRNIKRGFATNSSSYHSTLILTEDELEKWKNGEVTYNGLPHSALGSEEYYEEHGMYYYTESEEKREINGQVIIAITYCETNEY